MNYSKTIKELAILVLISIPAITLSYILGTFIASIGGIL